MARILRFVLLLLLWLSSLGGSIRDDDDLNPTAEAAAAPLSSDDDTPLDAAAEATPEQARKQYWRRTLDEIRNLSVNPTSRSYLTTQWKQWMDKSMQKPRFEGFVSWERLLQEWAEDIQEYMEKEHDEDYPFSTFGAPRVAAATATTVAPEGADDDQAGDITTVDGDSDEMSSRQKATLPIPRPALKGEAVLPHTDLADLSKHIWVTSTASLPWRTGTATNSLLRSAYLCRGRKEAGGSVTLHLPWLEREKDQEIVYGASNMFPSPEAQEAYVRTWLRDMAGMPEAADELAIEWYTAWLNKVENSIYSMGDITALIPEDKVDICILEEPEHLNWYRAPGESWTKKFKHVVGILHTNYFQYALDQPAALVRAPAMRLLCSWMIRAHCHRVIKLSGTLEPAAPEKELVENVHGVRNTFIDAGVALRGRLAAPEDDPIFGATAAPTVYFIGKMLWSKGMGSLMELLKFAEETTDLRIRVDMYGGGPDMKAAEAKSIKLGLDMPFHGPLDHSEIAFTHKIFVNPSTSEVLCTTSAEALAMGKFVILPSHPSNDFFAQFPNCLTYTTKEEFVANLYYAITHKPEPLSEEYAHALSWEAATERLAAAACIPVEEAIQLNQALATDSAAVEITLPPLIEDKEGRQLVAATLNKSRERYRQFRDRLSTEISQNKVLPKPIRERLVAELGKRLDIDIEEVLSSPKLKFQLSPAELDSSLLELYEVVSDSPGGDLLRLIGGGGAVALQNLYLRRQAERDRMKYGWLPDVFPSLVDEAHDDKDGGPLKRIRAAMRKNLPNNIRSQIPFSAASPTHKRIPSSSRSGKDTSLKMFPQRSMNCQSLGRLPQPIWGFRPPALSRLPRPAALTVKY